MRLIYLLRDALGRLVTAHSSPIRIGLAIGVGVFIGSSPFYGLHTIISLGLAYVFRLNKVAIVTGSWISNPLLAGPIIYGSLQLGSLLRHGHFYNLGSAGVDLEQLKSLYLNWRAASDLFIDWLAGGAMMGVLLGVGLGAFGGLTVRLKRKKALPSNIDRDGI